MLYTNCIYIYIHFSLSLVKFIFKYNNIHNYFLIRNMHWSFIHICPLTVISRCYYIYISQGFNILCL